MKKVLFYSCLALLVLVLPLGLMGCFGKGASQSDRLVGVWIYSHIDEEIAQGDVDRSELDQDIIANTAKYQNVTFEFKNDKTGVMQKPGTADATFVWRTIANGKVVADFDDAEKEDITFIYDNYGDQLVIGSEHDGDTYYILGVVFTRYNNN